MSGRCSVYVNMGHLLFFKMRGRGRMINKCPKCKSEIRADEQVNWKCASCKRSFKISFSRLDSVLSRKQSGDTIFQLKCPSCGKNLDSGREEISWSCFECGNKVSGNLMGFKEQMSGSVRNGNQNKGTVQQNTNINRNKILEREDGQEVC